MENPLSDTIEVKVMQRLHEIVEKLKEIKRTTGSYPDQINISLYDSFTEAAKLGEWEVNALIEVQSRVINQLPRVLMQNNIHVKIQVVGLQYTEYKEWLNGRPDSQNLRAEFMAKRLPRTLGVMIENGGMQTALMRIGFAMVQLPWDVFK